MDFSRQRYGERFKFLPKIIYSRSHRFFLNVYIGTYSTHKIFILIFFCKTHFRDQTTNNAAALPNKFDMNSTSLSKSSTNPYLKKSLTAFGSKSSGPNHDPGVNSDDDDDEELGDLENTRMEEDDMFR